MRKYALILASTLFLASCASVPVANPVDVTAVQKLATKLCGFLPALSTIADIIASYTGTSTTVTSAEQVAANICAAVVPPSGMASTMRAAVPTVNGVVVKGKFVR